MDSIRNLNQLKNNAYKGEKLFYKIILEIF
jgi:hypothetical protein